MESQVGEEIKTFSPNISLIPFLFYQYGSIIS